MMVEYPAPYTAVHAIPIATQVDSFGSCLPDRARVYPSNGTTPATLISSLLQILVH